MYQHGGVESPFHSGEKQLQALLGVAERAEELGRRVIRDHMPEQHQQFYAQLPFILLGVVDAEGWPWASLLEGAPGFAQAPDAQRLSIAAWPGEDDPAAACVAAGAAVGLLGIELHSRRRNRMNGRVEACAGEGFCVRVEQAFGNCPQYIQQRSLLPTAEACTAPAQWLDGLDAQAQAMIRRADTFFVASYADQGRRGVDVSHRGGRKGFVRVEGNRLLIPDFAGNRHFNTLGNLLVNPRAGLLFVDFDSGDVLQLVGDTTLLLQPPEWAGFEGAERFWTVQVRRAVRRPGALKLRWQFDDYSPKSLQTGAWPNT